MDAIFSPWLIWFLLGIGLAFLELQLPGFIVIFFGIGCWVVAGATLIWDLSAAQQVMLFIVSSIAALALLRKFLLQTFRGLAKDNAVTFDDFPGGVRVKVLQRITPVDKGRIHYRGTPWDAMADVEIEEGATVEIVRFADNSRQIFWVKPISEKE
jgi:membrane protein implicated in regulation of membrane protease activity